VDRRSPAQASTVHHPLCEALVCGAAVEQVLPELDIRWQHAIWALYYRLVDHAWIQMDDPARAVESSGVVGWTWHMQSSGTGGTAAVTCSLRG
jgi:hypothetical protein